MANEIYSSAGAAGLTERPDQRYYLNNGVHPLSLEYLSQSMRRMGTLVEGRFDNGRAVIRTAATDALVQKLFTTENEVFSHLEVAIPYECVSSGERNWLLMFGKNAPTRQPNQSREALQAKIAGARAKHPPSPATEHVARVVGNGYRFADQVTPELEAQLYELWSDTFGWQREQIAGLRNRLEKESVIPEERRGEKTVWFTGILRDDELVSAAMAERLVMRTENGSLNVVENTEWKTKNGFEKQGLVTAAVVGTNAKVLHDLSGLNTIVMAECNTAQGSISSAHRAGMDIPQQFYRVDGGNGQYQEIFIPQMILQNVVVNDGLNLSSPLRDFGPYVLDRESQAAYYSPEMTSATLAMMRGASR